MWLKTLKALKGAASNSTCRSDDCFERTRKISVCQVKNGQNGGDFPLKDTKVLVNIPIFWLKSRNFYSQCPVFERISLQLGCRIWLQGWIGGRSRVILYSCFPIVLAMCQKSHLIVVAGYAMFQRGVWCWNPFSTNRGLTRAILFSIFIFRVRGVRGVRVIFVSVFFAHVELKVIRRVNFKRNNTNYSL